MEYFFAECGRFRCVRVGGKKCTANTQIKNDARSRSQVNVQNRSRSASVPLQPLLDLFALWNRWKPASRTKSAVGETRLDFFEPLQGLPRKRFADRDIRIVRLNRFAVRGI